MLFSYFYIQKNMIYWKVIFIKKYVIPFLYSFFIIFVFSFIFSILYYFNIIGDKVNDVLLWITGVISIFVGSLKFSKGLRFKGLINGAIYYLVFLIISIILSLVIFKSDFDIKNIIYYVVLLLSSVLGGIIGKNIKADDND